MIQEINTVIGLIKTWFMLEDLMYLLMLYLKLKW
jgi:hypothetical protein